MNNELSYFLLRDYPSVFEKADIACRNGWYGLLRDVAEKILEHDRKYNVRTQIIWVGSIRGEISIQVNFEDREIKNILQQVADKSVETCDHCGAKGHPKHLYGQWRTSCENCEDV